MKKNILTIGLLTLVATLLFSSRSRNAVCNVLNEDSIDKIYEMKNVLADFKKNN